MSNTNRRGQAQPSTSLSSSASFTIDTNTVQPQQQQQQRDRESSVSGTVGDDAAGSPARLPRGTGRDYTAMLSEIGNASLTGFGAIDDAMASDSRNHAAAAAGARGSSTSAAGHGRVRNATHDTPLEAHLESFGADGPGSSQTDIAAQLAFSRQRADDESLEGLDILSAHGNNGGVFVDFSFTNPSTIGDETFFSTSVPSGGPNGSRMDGGAAAAAAIVASSGSSGTPVSPLSRVLATARGCDTTSVRRPSLLRGDEADNGTAERVQQQHQPPPHHSPVLESVAAMACSPSAQQSLQRLLCDPRLAPSAGGEALAMDEAVAVVLEYAEKSHHTFHHQHSHQHSHNSTSNGGGGGGRSGGAMVVTVPSVVCALCECVFRCAAHLSSLTQPTNADMIAHWVQLSAACPVKLVQIVTTALLMSPLAASEARYILHLRKGVSRDVIDSRETFFATKTLNSATSRHYAGHFGGVDEPRVMLLAMTLIRVLDAIVDCGTALQQQHRDAHALLTAAAAASSVSGVGAPPQLSSKQRNTNLRIVTGGAPSSTSLGAGGIAPAVVAGFSSLAAALAALLRIQLESRAAPVEPSSILRAVMMGLGEDLATTKTTSRSIISGGAAVAPPPAAASPLGTIRARSVAALEELLCVGREMLQHETDVTRAQSLGPYGWTLEHYIAIPRLLRVSSAEHLARSSSRIASWGRLAIDAQLLRLFPAAALSTTHRYEYTSDLLNDRTRPNQVHQHSQRQHRTSMLLLVNFARSSAVVFTKNVEGDQWVLDLALFRVAAKRGSRAAAKLQDTTGIGMDLGAQALAAAADSVPWSGLVHEFPSWRIVSPPPPAQHKTAGSSLSGHPFSTASQLHRARSDEVLVTVLRVVSVDWALCRVASVPDASVLPDDHALHMGNIVFIRTFLLRDVAALAHHSVPPLHLSGITSQVEQQQQLLPSTTTTVSYQDTLLVMLQRSSESYAVELQFADTRRVATRTEFNFILRSKASYALQSGVMLSGPIRNHPHSRHAGGGHGRAKQPSNSVVPLAAFESLVIAPSGSILLALPQLKDGNINTDLVINGDRLQQLVPRGQPLCVWRPTTLIECDAPLLDDTATSHEPFGTNSAAANGGGGAPIAKEGTAVFKESASDRSGKPTFPATLLHLMLQRIRAPQLHTHTPDCHTGPSSSPLVVAASVASAASKSASATQRSMGVSPLVLPVASGGKPTFPDQPLTASLAALPPPADTSSRQLLAQLFIDAITAVTNDATACSLWSQLDGDLRTPLLASLQFHIEVLRCLPHHSQAFLELTAGLKHRHTTACSSASSASASPANERLPQQQSQRPDAPSPFCGYMAGMHSAVVIAHSGAVPLWRTVDALTCYPLQLQHHDSRWDGIGGLVAKYYNEDAWDMLCVYLLGLLNVCAAGGRQDMLALLMSSMTYSCEGAELLFMWIKSERLGDAARGAYLPTQPYLVTSSSGGAAAAPQATAAPHPDGAQRSAPLKKRSDAAVPSLAPSLSPIAAYQQRATTFSSLLISPVEWFFMHAPLDALLDAPPSTTSAKSDTDRELAKVTMAMLLPDVQWVLGGYVTAVLQEVEAVSLAIAESVDGPTSSTAAATLALVSSSVRFEFILQGLLKRKLYQVATEFIALFRNPKQHILHEASKQAAAAATLSPTTFAGALEQQRTQKQKAKLWAAGGVLLEAFPFVNTYLGLPAVVTTTLGVEFTAFCIPSHDPPSREEIELFLKHRFRAIDEDTSLDITVVLLHALQRMVFRPGSDGYFAREDRKRMIIDHPETDLKYLVQVGCVSDFPMCERAGELLLHIRTMERRDVYYVGEVALPRSRPPALLEHKSKPLCDPLQFPFHWLLNRSLHRFADEQDLGIRGARFWSSPEFAVQARRSMHTRADVMNLPRTGALSFCTKIIEARPAGELPVTLQAHYDDDESSGEDDASGDDGDTAHRQRFDGRNVQNVSFLSAHASPVLQGLIGAPPLQSTSRTTVGGGANKTQAMQSGAGATASPSFGSPVSAGAGSSGGTSTGSSSTSSLTARRAAFYTLTIDGVTLLLSDFCELPQIAPFRPPPPAEAVHYAYVYPRAFDSVDETAGGSDGDGGAAVDVSAAALDLAAATPALRSALVGGSTSRPGFESSQPPASARGASSSHGNATAATTPHGTEATAPANTDENGDDADEEDEEDDDEEEEEDPDEIALGEYFPIPIEQLRRRGGFVFVDESKTSIVQIRALDNGVDLTFSAPKLLPVALQPQDRGIGAESEEGGDEDEEGDNDDESSDDDSNERERPLRRSNSSARRLTRNATPSAARDRPEPDAHHSGNIDGSMTVGTTASNNLVWLPVPPDERFQDWRDIGVTRFCWISGHVTQRASVVNSRFGGFALEVISAIPLEHSVLVAPTSLVAQVYAQQVRRSLESREQQQQQHQPRSAFEFPTVGDVTAQPTPPQLYANYVIFTLNAASGAIAGVASAAALQSRAGLSSVALSASRRRPMAESIADDLRLLTERLAMELSRNAVSSGQSSVCIASPDGVEARHHYASLHSLELYSSTPLQLAVRLHNAPVVRAMLRHEHAHSLWQATRPMSESGLAQDHSLLVEAVHLTALGNNDIRQIPFHNNVATAHGRPLLFPYALVRTSLDDIAAADFQLRFEAFRRTDEDGSARSTLASGSGRGGVVVGGAAIADESSWRHGWWFLQSRSSDRQLRLASRPLQRTSEGANYEAVAFALDVDPSANKFGAFVFFNANRDVIKIKDVVFPPRLHSSEPDGGLSGKGQKEGTDNYVYGPIETLLQLSMFEWYEGALPTEMMRAAFPRLTVRQLQSVAGNNNTSSPSGGATFDPAAVGTTPATGLSPPSSPPMQSGAAARRTFTAIWTMIEPTSAIPATMPEGAFAVTILATSQLAVVKRLRQQGAFAAGRGATGTSPTGTGNAAGPSAGGDSGGASIRAAETKHVVYLFPLMTDTRKWFPKVSRAPRISLAPSGADAHSSGIGGGPHGPLKPSVEVVEALIEASMRDPLCDAFGVYSSWHTVDLSVVALMFQYGLALSLAALMPKLRSTLEQRRAPPINKALLASMFNKVSLRVPYALCEDRGYAMSWLIESGLSLLHWGALLANDALLNSILQCFGPNTSYQLIWTTTDVLRLNPVHLAAYSGSPSIARTLVMVLTRPSDRLMLLNRFAYNDYSSLAINDEEEDSEAVRALRGSSSATQHSDAIGGSHVAVRIGNNRRSSAVAPPASISTLGGRRQESFQHHQQRSSALDHQFSRDMNTFSALSGRATPLITAIAFRHFSVAQTLMDLGASCAVRCRLQASAKRPDKDSRVPIRHQIKDALRMLDAHDVLLMREFVGERLGMVEHGTTLERLDRLSAAFQFVGEEAQDEFGDDENKQSDAAAALAGHGIDDDDDIAMLIVPTIPTDDSGGGGGVAEANSHMSVPADAARKPIAAIGTSAATPLASVGAVPQMLLRPRRVRRDVSAEKLLGEMRDDERIATKLNRQALTKLTVYMTGIILFLVALAYYSQILMNPHLHSSFEFGATHMLRSTFGPGGGEDVSTRSEMVEFIGGKFLETILRCAPNSRNNSLGDARIALSDTMITVGAILIGRSGIARPSPSPSGLRGGRSECYNGWCSSLSDFALLPPSSPSPALNSGTPAPSPESSSELRPWLTLRRSWPFHQSAFIESTHTRSYHAMRDQSWLTIPNNASADDIDAVRAFLATTDADPPLEHGEPFLINGTSAVFALATLYSVPLSRMVFVALMFELLPSGEIQYSTAIQPTITTLYSARGAGPYRPLAEAVLAVMWIIFVAFSVTSVTPYARAIISYLAVEARVRAQWPNTTHRSRRQIARDALRASVHVIQILYHWASRVFVQLALVAILTMMLVYHVELARIISADAIPAVETMAEALAVSPADPVAAKSVSVSFHLRTIRVLTAAAGIGGVISCLWTLVLVPQVGPFVASFLLLVLHRNVLMFFFAHLILGLGFSFALFTMYGFTLEEFRNYPVALINSISYITQGWGGVTTPGINGVDAVSATFLFIVFTMYITVIYIIVLWVVVWDAFEQTQEVSITWWFAFVEQSYRRWHLCPTVYHRRSHNERLSDEIRHLLEMREDGGDRREQ